MVRENKLIAVVLLIVVSINNSTDQLLNNWDSKPSSTNTHQTMGETMEFWSHRNRNSNKYPSPSKVLNLANEHLKLTLTVLARENKQEFVSEIKQSRNEKFNQLKGLFDKMSD